MPWLLLAWGGVIPAWRRVHSCQYFHAGVIGCSTPPKPIQGDAKAGLAVHRRTCSGCSPIRTGTETGRKLIVSALGRGPARMPRISVCAAGQRIWVSHLVFGSGLRITGTVGRRR